MRRTIDLILVVATVTVIGGSVLYSRKEAPPSDLQGTVAMVVTSPSAASCGDDTVEPPEECDYGSENDNSGWCTTLCTKAKCGDGFVRTATQDFHDANPNVPPPAFPPERCDDGNRNNEDACTNLCVDARCGDGIIWAGIEECDDSNTNDGDACTNLCQNAKCGDGSIRVGIEECDDGNDTDTDACTNKCKPAMCGDGSLWVGHEECDDGNSNNWDACVDMCKSARCGDTFLWEGHEECDDGDKNSNSARCTLKCKEARCGDTFVCTAKDPATGEPFEECDDGNRENGDGCDRYCYKEINCCGCAYQENQFCLDSSSGECTNVCQGECLVVDAACKSRFYGYCKDWLASSSCEPEYQYLWEREQPPPDMSACTSLHVMEMGHGSEQCVCFKKVVSACLSMCTNATCTLIESIGCSNFEDEAAVDQMIANIKAQYPDREILISANQTIATWPGCQTRIMYDVNIGAKKYDPCNPGGFCFDGSTSVECTAIDGTVKTINCCPCGDGNGVWGYSCSSSTASGKCDAYGEAFFCSDALAEARQSLVNCISAAGSLCSSRRGYYHAAVGPLTLDKLPLCSYSWSEYWWCDEMCLSPAG